MKPAEVQNAFSKFFRSAAVLNAAFPGAGLGLAITQSIVQAHQGTIVLVGDYGRGTTVTIILPGLVEVLQSVKPYGAPPRPAARSGIASVCLCQRCLGQRV